MLDPITIGGKSSFPIVDYSPDKRSLSGSESGFFVVLILQGAVDTKVFNSR
jgi:hypothetical protein